MKVKLELIGEMKLEAIDEKNNKTYFDTSKEIGGTETASSPFVIFLEAMAACSTMDIASILRKKRKIIKSLNIEVEAFRAKEHPRVITDVKVKYILESPDAELKDLERAAELSHTKYCFASAMFQNAGCNVLWECVVNSN